MTTESNQKYWKANLKILAILLFFWFFISFGLGIIFAKPLNEIKIGGFPLGFWFAQQGAIIGFIIIIAVYIRYMNKLDEKYNLKD